MKKQKVHDVYLALGALWVFAGFILFKDPAIWSLGFIFLIIGLIGKFGHKKKNNFE